MARFDVYAGARGKGFLLDCQADILSDLSTRIVVPLLPVAGLPRATRLNPVFDIDGEAYMMSTQLLFAIPVDRLSAPVGTLTQEHPVIMNALDLLLTGV